MDYINNNIPEKLHFLIPLIDEWGIGDDRYREEKIECASISDLKEFLANFGDNVLELISARCFTCNYEGDSIVTTTGIQMEGEFPLYREYNYGSIVEIFFFLEMVIIQKMDVMKE